MPENSPGSRDNNPNITEQVQHSGVHGYESPVYDFGNQTLEDAIKSGALHAEIDEHGRTIYVPDSLGDHLDPTKSTPTEAHVPLTNTDTMTETAVPATTEKRFSLPKKIGMGVSALLLAGGAALGVSSMGNAEAPRDTTSANPSNEGEPGSAVGEKEAPEQSTESIVGKSNTTLEGANVTVPLEVAELATRPILASEHTPTEAAKLYSQYLNIYLLSGQVEISPSGDATTTPESIEIGKRIEENLDGTVEMRRENGIYMDDLRRVRQDLANTMAYTNYEGNKNNAATYHRESEILEHTQVDENTHVIRMETTLTTNLAEMDSHWVIEPVQVVTQDLTLKVIDGRYIGAGLTNVE